MAGISNGGVTPLTHLNRRQILGFGGSAVVAAALHGCAVEGVGGNNNTGLADTAARAKFTMKPVTTATTVSYPAQLRSNSGVVTALSARDFGNLAPDTNAIVGLTTGAKEELPAEGNANFELKISDTLSVLLYNEGFYVRNNSALGEKIAYQQGTLGNSAVVIGDKLFVTTSGLSTGTPQYVTGGHVLVYNVSDLTKDAADVRTEHVITTAGLNPTGVGVVVEYGDSQADARELLVVMQSGGAEDKQASVRVYDPSGANGEFPKLKTFNLPAGDIGQDDKILQVSDDGYVFVGTANAPNEDGTGNFYKIDLFANDGDESDYITGRTNTGTNYHNAVVYDQINRRVYIAAYNEGWEFVLDADTLEVLDRRALDNLSGPIVLADDPEGSGARGVLALESSGNLYWFGEEK